MSDRAPQVYILSNPSRTVLYIGVTTNLSQRLEQHRAKAVPGFTTKYNCIDLVYSEEIPTIEQAIIREKQLKGWSREKKEDLIRVLNPSLVDLSTTL